LVFDAQKRTAYTVTATFLETNGSTIFIKDIKQANAFMKQGILRCDIKQIEEWLKNGKTP
jgi:prophage maintenance system killer protein